MNVADLLSARDRLLSARLHGMKEVHDSNGESVTYKSDGEMRAALAALDAEIAKLAGQPVREIRFSTSKGL